ncbi:MAG: hypothetical protein CM1200mP18_01450 [Gammaproteobacteria bacterium]|nr:MAG: hypothetical protein CM1200mP18_01450 [Gammaproteobacteria bacterium]
MHHRSVNLSRSVRHRLKADYPLADQELNIGPGLLHRNISRYYAVEDVDAKICYADVVFFFLLFEDHQSMTDFSSKPGTLKGSTIGVAKIQSRYFQFFE